MENFHRQRVEKIQAKNKLLTEGGAENKVFESPDKKSVIKVSKGKVASPTGNYSFDLENISKRMRLEILSEHIISEALSILYPEYVPKRRNIFSKSYPSFSQEKVEGVRVGDDVETESVGIVSEDPELVRKTNTPGSSFRIKAQKIVTRPTEKGKEMLLDAKNKMDWFERELFNLGIEIDRWVGDGSLNFIKTQENFYKYIDSFVITDKKKTIEKIRRKVISDFSSGKLDSEKVLKISHILNKLDNLTRN